MGCDKCIRLCQRHPCDDLEAVAGSVGWQADIPNGNWRIVYLWEIIQAEWCILRDSDPFLSERVKAAIR